MIKCSICKKNVAVIFIPKTINGKQEMIGLCMNCAKKQGISPMKYILQQTNFSEEDLENLNEQMNSLFEDINVDNIDEINNNPNSLFNFISNAFSGIKSSNEKDFQSSNESEVSSNSTETKSTKNEKKKKKKKYLDHYGINLTEKAKKNEVDRIIGRNREIDRVIQIINRRTKNNPILIGEPGVGKTAIAEGLAVRIVEKQVPLKLRNTEVYLLDLTAVVAGTQFRGQFEGRMQSIIKEAKTCGNIILVIDEVHNIIGAGTAEGGAMNAANILKPALARGEIQVIGTTTLEEYKKYIEKDSALERRFQPVLVEEPSVSETIEIIKGIKDYYEKYHKVYIPDEVIEGAVKLSKRYITDRFLPDKAIDVLDEAGSRANLKNQGLVELEALKEELALVQSKKEEAASMDDYEKAAEYKVEECRLQDKIEKLKKQSSKVIITMDDVASVIESWTKIPVQKITQIEAEKLLTLEDNLHKRIIGQHKAVVSLSKAIRRNRSGFKKVKRPSSFIFVGPTGVGKTELVKTLASELFGSEEALIRIDMSEYMEKHAVSKLIGSPPGYVGYDEGGQLTEKIRRRPYSVILLDEIEKAHPDVFNMLLQILEDGRLTDSQGRTVHFENTIIIMTSNAGTNLKAHGIGFEKNNYHALENKVHDALKETFRAEFLNRIDEVIVFTELSKEELKQIINLMLKEVISEAREKNIILKIDDDVKDFILEKSYDPKYGARPLRRNIQKFIEDELAELFLKGEISEGNTVHVKLKDDKIIFI
ncbi:ATP-dependent Clp protease ATP-binding subunit [Defluviitalea phaphyphila]|uniref:ATP-dependent Clp protease ATP-binding subunit n=1 Tax=Defluviitalea phaphyphila TaxID=1473580 RepID=UPI000730E841|nr:ATP-dependent Clp protease ATP-binding subunit [Defluviitalea phaphyphila]